jgi:Amt family ammonium transporter
MFGGVGGVTFGSQAIGTVICITIALIGSYITYKILDKTVGIRLNAREETLGSDLVVHSSKAYPEDLF